MNHEEISTFIEKNPLCKLALQDHFHNARGLIKSFHPQLDDHQVTAIINYWLMTVKKKIKTTAPQKWIEPKSRD